MKELFYDCGEIETVSKQRSFSKLQKAKHYFVFHLLIHVFSLLCYILSLCRNVSINQLFLLCVRISLERLIITLVRHGYFSDIKWS